MNLIVSSITMVDLTNKEAKRVHFHAGKNLRTSDHNHLGKSVIMKSIFYALGAEVFFPTPIEPPPMRRIKKPSKIHISTSGSTSDGKPTF